MACLVNLDLSEQPFVSFEIVDDVRNVCRSVSVRFFSDKQLNFEKDVDWFTAFKSDWIPNRIKETHGNDLWSYEIVAFPRGAFKKITSTIKNTRDYCNHVNIPMSSDSVSLEVPVSMINIDPITFASRLRGQSILMNKNDFGKTIMIYFDNSVLISKTMSSIIGTKSEVYENKSALIEGVNFFDSRTDRLHYSDMLIPKAMTPREIFDSHIGRTVVIQSSAPAQIFKNYTISVQDRKLPKMTCIGVDMNLNNQPQVYMNTFVEFI